MAGSRIEKYGSIFTRLQGLLRSGALQKADCPIWYEVYKAFPPKQDPILERRKPPQDVRNILYPEDFIRVKFYQTYGNPDVVDLTKENVKTTCQKFIDKYMELQKDGKDSGELFEQTVKALQSDGIRLRTVNEVQKSQAAASEAGKRTPAAPVKLSVADVFGEKTAGKSDAVEEKDFVLDDVDDFLKKKT